VPITATEVAQYTNPDQVANGVTAPSAKWFSLQDNRLDGTFKLMGSGEVGWWGTTLSDASGNISTNPKLTIEQERVIHTLQLAGDSLLGEYPVDFTFKLYNGSTLLYTETVTGNNQVIWKKPLPQSYDTTKVELTVTKVNKANRTAKVLDALSLFELCRGDSLSAKVDGSKSISASFTRTDSLLVKTSETIISVGIAIISADILGVNISEADSIQAQLSRSDILQVALVDSSFFALYEILRTDSLSLGLSESDSLMASIYRQDNLPISLSEVDSLQVQMSKSDTLAVLLDSMNLIIALTDRADSLLFAVAEEQNPVQAEVKTQDEIKLLVDEAKNLSVSFLSQDSFAVSLGESKGLESWLSSSDILNTTITNNSAVTVNVLADDSLGLLVTESKSIVASLLSSDVIAPLLAESRQITVNLTSQEQLLTKIDGSKSVTVQLAGIDNVLVKMANGKAITAMLDDSDSLTISVLESVDMTNIHTVMDSMDRKILAKVEIVYTDPMMDQSIAIAASSTAYPTSAQQTANNVLAPAYKWFSLHNNKLDGTFHPMSGESVGWWSGVVSNGSGVFAIAPKLAVNFDPRPVYLLQVVGDDLLNEYPVDFIIKLYDSTDVLIHSEAVTGNSEVNWQKPVEPILNVAKAELEIQKINKANSTAKVQEFFTVVKEEYLADNLLSIRLLEELEYKIGAGLGNISANEIVVRFDNSERYFDAGNPESPLKDLLRKNRKLKAWFGAEVVEGEIEWHPAGVFFTQKWFSPENELWAEVSAWDRMEMLRNSEFNSEVYPNKSLGELAEIVFQDAGLTPEEYEIDSALYNIVIPWAWFEKSSHRDALQVIVNAGLAVAYCDRYGKIALKVISPDPNPMFEFDMDNIFGKDNPSSEDEINYVEVVSSPRKPGNLEYVHDDSDEVELLPGDKLSITYFYSSSPVVDAEMTEITAGADISILEYKAYSWGMSVVFENTGATAQTISNVKIAGKKLNVEGAKLAVAKDEKGIRDNGKLGLQSPIKNNLIQTLSIAQAIANSLLESNKMARRDATLDARGDISLRLGDSIIAPDYRTITKSKYFVTKQECTWDGIFRAAVTAHKFGGA